MNSPGRSIVLQNHLLQVLAYVCMEPPESLDPGEMALLLNQPRSAIVRRQARRDEFAEAGELVATIF